MLIGIWSHARGQRLVEQRKGEIRDIDDLELGVGPSGGNLIYPLGDGCAETPGACASDNDGYLRHDEIPSARCGDRTSVVSGTRVSVRVHIGGRRTTKKTNNPKSTL